MLKGKEDNKFQLFFMKELQGVLLKNALSLISDLIITFSESTLHLPYRSASYLRGVEQNSTPPSLGVENVRRIVLGGGGEPSKQIIKMMFKKKKKRPVHFRVNFTICISKQWRDLKTIYRLDF